MASKIHVEVFVAAQLLSRRQRTFTPEELVAEIVRRFDDRRLGVQTHVTAHCVANLPRSANNVYNYLWRLDRGLLRVFSPDVDLPHPDRQDAPTRPDPADVPEAYRYLLEAPAASGARGASSPIIGGAPPTFYLVRTAQTHEQLQENLRILAALVGTPLTVYYPRGVADVPEGLERGASLCIVFSDPPYDHFVPVRRARVMDVSFTEGDVALTLIMDALAEGFIPNVPSYEEGLARFSEGLRKAHCRQAPVAACSPAVNVAFVPEGEDDRAVWRRIIDAIRTLGGDAGRYARTVFLRPLELTDTDGHIVPLGGALAVGKVYRQVLDCYAPHLADGDPAEYGIILDASATHLPLPDVLPLVVDGELSLDLIPIEPGKIALELWVRPDRALSTTLRLRYPVVESATIAAPAVDMLAVRLTDWHLKAIFEVIQQPEGPERSRAQLGLIDYVLAPLSYDSHYLREQRGLVLTELGRWGEAYAQFAALDPDRLTPQTVAIWFISACRSGDDADLGTILDHFNAWEDRALVRQMIDALPMVEEEKRLHLLETSWFQAGSHREMWETVKDTFTRPETVLRAARLMVDPDAYHILSPAEGYLYLRERMAAMGEMTLPLLRQAVDWGLQEAEHAPGLDEVVLELVRRLLEDGDDPLEAWVVVSRARDLAPHAWAAAAEPLADALARHPHPGWRDEACKLYVELARVHRERLQVLDVAEQYLARASLLAGDDPELRALVETEETKLTSVVQRIEAVRLWWQEVQQARQQGSRRG